VVGLFDRGPGDIQTAVVNLVSRLAPVVPIAGQPKLAREIAGAIAALPSSMSDSMRLRQSIIRRRAATDDDVVDGLAAWVTVLFDLGNLQHDRGRALKVDAVIADAALGRLAAALAESRNGCILAVPHIGSIELFLAVLKDRGFNTGFVYTIGDEPTPTEAWIHAGRSATQATPIAFGRRDTGAGISKMLENNGVVIMVVDVYPSAKYKGIRVGVHDAEFNYPPGPARFARSGTLVLPGFASLRREDGFSMDILDPVEPVAGQAAADAAAAFSQSLAEYVGRFTAEQPEAFWLWHPIPNDPFIRILLAGRLAFLKQAAAAPDDEAVALAVEACGFAERLLPAG
jgi:hypothetical protein